MSLQYKDVESPSFPKSNWPPHHGRELVYDKVSVLVVFDLEKVWLRSGSRWHDHKTQSLSSTTTSSFLQLLNMELHFKTRFLFSLESLLGKRHWTLALNKFVEEVNMRSNRLLTVYFSLYRLIGIQFLLTSLDLLIISYPR